MASCGATAGTWRFTSSDWLQSRNSWISQHTTTFAERLKMCPCPFVRAVQWSWRNPLFDNGMTTVGGSSADTDGRGIQSEWKKNRNKHDPLSYHHYIHFLATRAQDCLRSTWGFITTRYTREEWWNFSHFTFSLFVRVFQWQTYFIKSSNPNGFLGLQLQWKTNEIAATLH